MTDTSETSAPNSNTSPFRIPNSAFNPPHPHQFPDYPPGWFLFCHKNDLTNRPHGKTLFNKRLVAFLDHHKNPRILDAHCSHMGADLSLGTLHNNCLRCPFHHWHYAPDGTCTHIPAQKEIPHFARQRTYPAKFLGPHLFVFNAPHPPHAAPFDLPFFPNQNPAHFTPAKPFSTIINAPWYLVAANGFDSQHFIAAHDRTLTAPIQVDSPTPHSHRAICELAITGTSWRDALTRALSGPKYTMTVNDYLGTLTFVTAQFRRTTTYGMVNLLPLDQNKTQVTVIVWVPKSKNPLTRAILDPLQRRARSYFIKKFLEPDVQILNNTTYHPKRLIQADETMAEFLTWLASKTGGATST